MKLIKGILGCALAAGLTTFAANQAQAGVVVDNGLYSTLQVKLVVSYKDPSTGKFKKASVTNKQILADLEPSTKNISLVAATAGDFDGDFGDVFIYSSKTKTLGDDLTEDSVFTIDANELIFNETENKNSETETSAGTVSINFYDDPQFPGEVFSADASQGASDNWFEITGVYNATEKFTDAKNGENISAKTQATSLSGTGQFTPNSAVGKTAPTPVTGSASTTGSGIIEE
jgi:hypothetical protein